MFAKRSLKTIVILIGLAALLLAGCSTAQKKSKSEDIRKVADQIASYSLPEGYSEQFALNLLGYQLVSLQGKTENCHIFLMQAPKDSDVDLMELKDQNQSKDYRHPGKMRVVETRTAILRGQEVAVLVGEGINSEKQTYREITALFAGRNGPAAVNIASPVDQWNWEQVDAFLASLD